jgi:hypothetical protein
MDELIEQSGSQSYCLKGFTCIKFSKPECPFLSDGRKFSDCDAFQSANEQEEIPFDKATKIIGDALQEAEMRQGCTDYRFYAMQIAQQIDKLYRDHFASQTPEGLKELIAKAIHDDWTVAGKPWDKMYPEEQQEWLKTAAKLTPYLEAERERVLQDYKDKVRTILCNYADFITFNDEVPETKLYYINGKSVDEFMDEIDSVEIKAKHLTTG